MRPKRWTAEELRRAEEEVGILPPSTERPRIRLAEDRTPLGNRLGVLAVISGVAGMFPIIFGLYNGREYVTHPAWWAVGVGIALCTPVTVFALVCAGLAILAFADWMIHG
jgi:hypothetical protein